MKIFNMVVLAGLLLSACGMDRPSPEMAKQAIQARVSGPLADKLHLQTFRKTDGQASELRGVSMYALDYSATLEFLDDMLYEVSDNTIKASPVGPTLNDKRGFSWDAFFNTAVAGRKPGFVGDRLSMIGTVIFEKKESGWVVMAINFNTTMDSSSRTTQVMPSSQAPNQVTPDNQDLLESKAAVSISKDRSSSRVPSVIEGGWYNGGDYRAYISYVQSSGAYRFRLWNSESKPESAFDILLYEIDGRVTDKDGKVLVSGYSENNIRIELTRDVEDKYGNVMGPGGNFPFNVGFTPDIYSNLK